MLKLILSKLTNIINRVTNPHKSSTSNGVKQFHQHFHTTVTQVQDGPSAVISPQSQINMELVKVYTSIKMFQFICEPIFKNATLH